MFRCLFAKESACAKSGLILPELGTKRAFAYYPVKLQFIGFILGIGSSGVLVTQAAAPHIEFEKTVWDFGTISRADSVKGTFGFRNTGDAVLNVEEPTTSCGCITAELKDRSIPSGHKCEVTFTLTMPSVRSVLNRHIFITSNDPQNSKVTLSAKAVYVPVFEIEPFLLPVNVPAGQTTNVVALVRRTDGQPLNIARLEPTKPWIKARVEKIAERNNTEARILIQASPEGNPRYFTESVRVFTDTSEQPVVSAVLMGRVLGELRVEPEELSWNLDDFAASAESQASFATRQHLSVTSRAPGHLELHNIVSTLEEVQVEVTPREKDNGYDLVAKLVKLPKTTTRGTIRFDTNIPNEPTAQVPLTIKVTEH